MRLQHTLSFALTVTATACMLAQEAAPAESTAAAAVVAPAAEAPAEEAPAFDRSVLYLADAAPAPLVNRVYQGGYRPVNQPTVLVVKE